MTQSSEGLDRETSRRLAEALGLREGQQAFPWQEALLARFIAGNIDRALDIPTGLGKTAVMAIWLLAYAAARRVPRRLVYIVDRRAVVDQATTVAEKLRALVAKDQMFRHALGLGDRDLSISTLRGQHVDNRQWLETPSLPAIIVGTVDKIGSALLFRGYGLSNKMRAYHAGLLGADSLVVLDEAHLVPPFEALLANIADGTEMFGPRNESLRKIVPPMTFMSLSATGRRIDEGRAFGLGAADTADPRVRQRLDAKKGITILPAIERGTLAEALAREAWDLSHDGQAPARIVIFTDRRETAAKAKQALEARGDVDAQLFVGERRVRERLQLEEWLEKRGFIGGNTVALERPAFVFATSAGEVGGRDV